MQRTPKVRFLALVVMAIAAHSLLVGCHRARQAPPPRPRRAYVPPPPQQHPSPSAPTPQPRPTPPRYAGPAWFPSGGKISSRWTTVVVHHSATPTGDARSFDRFHRDKGWDELGYHFVIGNGTSTGDGAIEVGSRWHKQKTGAHCKTASNYYNEHGIGICLVGDFTKTRPTRKQLASLTALTQFLSQECGISPDRVTTHGLINHTTKCPGQNFAIAPLRNSIAQGLASSYR